jgi:hypothetical protein
MAYTFHGILLFCRICGDRGSAVRLGLRGKWRWEEELARRTRRSRRMERPFWLSNLNEVLKCAPHDYLSILTARAKGLDSSRQDPNTSIAEDGENLLIVSRHAKL